MLNHKNIPHATLWQNNKTGGVYLVITIVTIEKTDTPAVAYKGQNVVQRDDIWVRPVDEFLEKFTRIDLNPVEVAEILKRKMNGDM